MENLTKKTKAVGGNGGGPFKAHIDGETISKIDFYSNGVFLRGMEVFFSNGEKKMIAAKTDKKVTIEFGENKFKEVKIYPNSKNNRCGNVSVKYENDKTVSVGLASGSSEVINNCYIIGVEGRCGADIDNLAFIYSDKSLKDIVGGAKDLLGGMGGL